MLRKIFKKSIRSANTSSRIYADIDEANGATYVIDQTTGNVSVVDGLKLRPLKSPSAEVFTLGVDYPISNSVVDFDFLVTDDHVYWSGKVMPNIDSEEFESDEEREAFLDLWRRNITKSGNHITFRIEPLTSDITFGEFRINMSELNVATRDDDGNITYRSGNGIEVVNFDYELINSQGGTGSLFVSPVYVLSIED